MFKFSKTSFYTLFGLPPMYYFGKKWRGRACVLCYHRVMPDEIAKKEEPNSILVVPASRFAEQMETLARYYDVVSIDELVEHLDGDSNKFVVAVTIDDGYKDNLTHALPILERFHIPATIYITTRFPEGDTWLWWYEIWDYLINIESLEVNYLGRKKCWDTKSFKEKFFCFSQLRDWMISCGYKQQMELMDAITSSSERKQYPELCLTWNEIYTLDQHPLITIGAHTHSHSNLRSLTKENALSEMLQSKILLEEKLSHSVKHFAYPYGTKNEADTREFQLATDCNFKSAVTTRPDANFSHSLYSIPRLGVPVNLNRLGIKGFLSGWVHLIRKFL